MIKDIKAVNMGENTDNCFWFNVDTNPKGKKFILGAQTDNERQDWVEMYLLPSFSPFPFCFPDNFHPRKGSCSHRPAQSL